MLISPALWEGEQKMSECFLNAALLPAFFSNNPVQFGHSAVCENASDLSLWAKKEENEDCEAF